MEPQEYGDVPKNESPPLEIPPDSGSRDGPLAWTPDSPQARTPLVEEPSSCSGRDTPASEGGFPNINHVLFSRGIVDTPTPDTASVATDHLDMDQDICTPTPSVTDVRAEDTESESDDDDEGSVSYELQKGSRILKEIMREANKSITWPFKNAVDSDASGCNEYYQVVEKPIWLKKSEYTAKIVPYLIFNIWKSVQILLNKYYIIKYFLFPRWNVLNYIYYSCMNVHPKSHCINCIVFRNQTALQFTL